MRVLASPGSSSVADSRFKGVAMVTCQGCGSSFQGRPLRVFCSNACQRVAQQRLLVERWLATGVAVVNSDRSHYIRLHLFEQQHGLCGICGTENQWQGLPLVFVLDHIDGDADNNWRENLRLICPNCDSQLATFKNRNAGKGRHWRRQRYANGQSY
jgi:endogenous inhibitor of DNA gyrase (YacG/DUF329 family)